MPSSKKHILEKHHVLTQTLLGGCFATCSCISLCFLLDSKLSSSIVISTFIFTAVCSGIYLAHQSILNNIINKSKCWIKSLSVLAISFMLAISAAFFVFPIIYTKEVYGIFDWPAPFAFTKDIAIYWIMVSIFGLNWFTQHLDRITEHATEIIVLRIEWKWGLLAIGVSGILLAILEFIVLSSPRTGLYGAGFKSFSIVRDICGAAAAIELLIWYRLKDLEGGKKKSPEECSADANGEKKTVLGYKILKERGCSVSETVLLNETPDLARLKMEAKEENIDLLYIALKPGPRMIYSPETNIQHPIDIQEVKANNEPMFAAAAAKTLLLLCKNGDCFYPKREVIKVSEKGFDVGTIMGRRSVVNKIFKTLKLRAYEDRILRKDGEGIQCKGITELSILMLVTEEVVSFLPV